MPTVEFLYVMSNARCQNFYSMVDFKNPPPFDPGFLASANNLAGPEAGDKDVLEFIEYYGTHFFTDVTFGAKFVQKHKVSQTAYQSLKKSKISVEVQASYSGLISIGGGFSLDKEQSEAASNFLKGCRDDHLYRRLHPTGQWRCYDLGFFCQAESCSYAVFTL